ncbi:F-box/kelch-repeat protein At3g06240-like [Papaver somniferum]|uniref:F-box/kelch-repeat protein At3g06240-like n=1 Tax=Papaver somniferum TaxID=3469 RepID=UPI000E6F4FCF|nr:F-box/kelch-repeat protein At3g06240-like [Papaver somniferum]
MLPEINTDYSYVDDVLWTSGFGYVSATAEYKVVRIYKLKNKFVEVCIYTLGGGNGWRNLGKFDPSFSPSDWEQDVFANGALHWMGDELEIIVTFNLAEEKFCQHLSPPPLPPNGCWSLNRIGVFDGILFFASYGRGNKSDDLWLLKKKNGNDGIKEGEEHLSLGWSKEFRVVHSTKLLAVTKSGGILTYIDLFLYICNPKTLKLKRLFDFKERILVVFPHKNTLVSLKEIGEEDTKIMESIIEETESHDQPLLQL